MAPLSSGAGEEALDVAASVSVSEKGEWGKTFVRMSAQRLGNNGLNLKRSFSRPSSLGVTKYALWLDNLLAEDLHPVTFVVLCRGTTAVHRR